MHKTTLFLLLIAIFYSNHLLANGGSIDKGSFLYNCNEISLIKEENIFLEKEDLFFHIVEDYIYVTANYTLKNNGPKKNIKYGFAVDYRDSEYYLWDEDYIKDFTIICNENKLLYTNKEEKNIKTDEFENNITDSGILSDNISRRWYISDLDFNEQEKIQLKVTYRVKTSFADWPMMNSQIEDYQSTPHSDREFSYYLKPSGFWGNGEANSFKLTISFDNIEKYEHLKIKQIEQFELINNKYILKKEHYNLLKNPSIKLSYNYGKWENSQNAIKFSNFEIVKKISCSSEDYEYPLSNLFDKNKNTTFVPMEPKNSTIHIEFKENVILYGVAILNGYMKNSSVYNNNNAISKLKITTEFTTYDNQIKIEEEIITLNRKKKIEDNIFTSIEDILLGDIYGDITGGDFALMKNIHSLTIEILDVDKGLKYNDTCISELLLYGKFIK